MIIKKIELEKELKEKRDEILDLETKLKNSELSTEEKDDDNKKLKEPTEIYDDMIKEKSYDSHGFDKDSFSKYTDRRYDPNGFNKDGFYKDTNNK